ncbi:two-component sensor histidine kinase [Actinoplanes cyaneus]|uniref:Two-component sensor histidine kinase n=1 Tax=Actinoplanes cyaneus TaxID=52696 RepID=A0A919IT03_9ACTN|nr:sensor histidine kinase [Actinoplanes cyaneus]MCW2142380.1 Signal transduction histidine kinase [Actinoplanes cyaneus]GID70878.1 two-component sensor histidine kinase [Actinoplanes cyaneus]
MPDDVPLAGPEGRLSRGPDEWLRWLPLWDAYFVLVAAATAVAVALAGEPLPRRAAAIALIALLAAAHLTAGRRLIRAGHAAVIYQLAVVAVFAVAVGLVTRSAFLLFALCAPAFMTTGPFIGALVVVVLNLVWIRSSPFSAPGLAAAMLSILLGIWASKIIKQSTERGALIRELEKTRAELERVSYEAGRAAEREQVADAVHDTLAQGLSSTIMLLQAARAALATDPDRAARHLDLAESTTRDNLADARALITARPLPEATGGSLAEALRREAEKLRALTGIEVTLEVAGVFTTALDVELLRLAQEALSNVRKHAGASRVTILVTEKDGRVRLEIIDDGRGFCAARTPDGHGLPLMRRRLHEASGSLVIDSAPGEGTRLRIEVPA